MCSHLTRVFACFLSVLGRCSASNLIHNACTASQNSKAFFLAAMQIASKTLCVNRHLKGHKFWVDYEFFKKVGKPILSILID